jgi:hypothetical protein
MAGSRTEVTETEIEAPAIQEDLRRADGRQERTVRILAQSFAFGVPGFHFFARPRGQGVKGTTKKGDLPT